jgi:hypothetical protein
MSYMEITTHHQRAEIAADRRSPFRPHQGLTVHNLFLDTILDRTTWEACPIDCMDVMGNISCMY